MEKVIHEFKIIETEDGFRIEIKGNKEAIRPMLKGFERCFGGGMPFGRGFHFDFGPGFWGGFGGFSRWCRAWQDPEEEQKRV